MNRAVRFDDVRALLVSHIDLAGISRVRVLPHRRLLSASTHGVTLGADTAFGLAVDDHVTATTAVGSAVGDVRGIADLSSMALLDAESGLAWAAADLYALDGTVHPTCTRSALRRVVDDAEDARVAFSVGFELECSVFRGIPRDPESATSGPAHSTRAALEGEGFTLAALAALEFAGVPVEQLHPAGGDGRMEFALAARDPLTAVDDLALARVVLTRVAQAQGLGISFAPVPIVGGTTNGCHMHLSAVREGRNVFAEPSANHGIARDGGRMIAGIIARLPEGVALLGGSVLSFARLRPGEGAGAHACWGTGNREAAVRLVPGQAGMGAEQANIEIRAVDAAANPYLAVAAIIAAAMDGLERAVRLPRPVGADPGTLTTAERRAAGIRTLPADLGAALDRLESSEFHRGVLGDVLLDAYVATRRHEGEAFGEQSPEAVADAVRRRY
jgi:glutamine synthetase